MKRYLDRRLTLAIVLLLAACGGDSGQKSGSVVVPVTPTPSPTPTPTPTPTFSYLPVNDYTTDWSYSGLDRYVVMSFDYTVPVPDDPENPVVSDTTVVSLSYGAVDGRLTFEFFLPKLTLGSTTAVFTAADRIASPVGTRAYQNGDDRLLLSTPANTQYVGRVARLVRGTSDAIGRLTGNWDVLRIALYGPPTFPADSLPSGVTYKGQLLMNQQSAPGAGVDKMESQLTLPLDLALAADGTTVSGRVAVPKGEGTLQVAATFRFEGQLDRATGRVSGKVTDEVAPMADDKGSFTGRLYGPKGVEIGLTMRMERWPNGRLTYVGDFTGKR